MCGALCVDLAGFAVWSEDTQPGLVVRLLFVGVSFHLVSHSVVTQCFCLDEVSDEPPAPDVSKLLCAYNSAIDDEIETRKV